MRPGTISLIFFVIELILLIITIIKNRDHPWAKPIFMIMGLLQIYQLTEFLLCIGINENVVGRIAITTITFLPPMGYYLTAKVTRWPFKDYWIWFLIATGLSSYYIFVPQSIDLVDCNPFYAIYNIPLGQLYGIYYFGLILLAICLIGLQAARRQIQAVRWSIILLIGYLTFTVPMGLIILIDQSYVIGITSIMCKYAILLAITLFIFSFIKSKR